MGVWSKHPVQWRDPDGRICLSIVFSWQVPQAVALAFATPQARYLVGGPGVYLMESVVSWPSNVEIGRDMPGALQRHNPTATRTTIGCPNMCGFCGVSQGIEGSFKELDTWPDGTTFCDNNITAASEAHFDKVMDRIGNGPADFNQGVDCRLLNEHHAERFGRNKNIVVRLALDHQNLKPQWMRAYELIRKAGVAKSRIRSYVLCGYKTGPEDAWDRCVFVEDQNTMALPMWYHSLTATKHNEVTKEQDDNGWNDYERRRIMKWFYWHQEIKK